MSSIAGIVRRDGRPTPESWVAELEKALGSTLWRYEDSVPIASGNLHILLLWTEEGKTQKSIGGEEASATWNEETLELTLSRRGIGKSPLYTLDLGEAGDGLLFCSNPMPLSKIAHALELQNSNLLHATQQYLQLGFVTGNESLVSPVQSVPLQYKRGNTNCEPTNYTHECTYAPAEDVIALVTQLGQPFSDYTLLSRLALYRSAKEHGKTIGDGLPSVSERVQQTEKLSRWQGILSQLPIQQNAKDWSKYGIATVDSVFDSERIEQLTGQRYETPFCPHYRGSIEEQLRSYDEEIRNPDAIISGMHACAEIARVTLQIGEWTPEPLPTYPLASWLRGPQSSLGELASDVFHSENAFRELPIEQAVVREMFIAHQKETCDYAAELFALLTLALWSQLVDA